MAPHRMNTLPPVTLTLPPWINTRIATLQKPPPLITDVDRMRFVIALAQENSKQRTGGPFAAAVFDRANGMLIAAGINRVVPLNCSLAHAEMIALSSAQQRLETYDLSSHGNYELVTSTAPCAMCLGAIPWSGVRRLVCGATDADARAVGFDEGAKVANWVNELERRGIEVVTECCRDTAKAALLQYQDLGGVVYNGRSSVNNSSSAPLL